MTSSAPSELTTFDTYADLRAHLKAVAQTEKGTFFMGWPDRWWDAPHWRCRNGHVSTRYLKSEALGYDACLAGGCQEPLCLTYPEDTEV